MIYIYEEAETKKYETNVYYVEFNDSILCNQIKIMDYMVQYHHGSE